MADRPGFRQLRVADVRRETDECLSIALDVPPDLADDFRYLPGQYLTFRTVVDGVEVRRSYSLCTAPGDNELRVAVKQVPGGAFSSYVATKVRPGDLIEVMTPEGRFTPAPDPKPTRQQPKRQPRSKRKGRPAGSPPSDASKEDLTDESKEES